MTTLYGSLPNFTAGQVLSASAHLNSLQKCLTLMHDDVAGVSTPALGTTSYIIRHQWNILEYSLVRGATGTITIKYDTTTVLTITTGGAQSGTVDLTSFHFTVDQFYALTVTGTGTTVNGFVLYYLREKQTTSYPALASFADETTPSAAEWQALTTYAGLVSAALDVPQPVNTRLFHHDKATYTTYHALIHRGKWLKLYYKKTTPWDCQSGDRWIRVIVYAGAVSVYDSGETGNLTYNSEIDLTAAGLTFGQDYILKLVVSQNQCGQDGSFWLYSMYEIPEVGDAIAGWTPFKEWSHANYVWGSDNPIHNAKKMQTVTANLGALAAAIDEVMYPSPERGAALGDNAFLYAVRRRRFLHFKTQTDESCTINWSYRGENQQANLGQSDTAFMSADLDSLEGLYPGTAYWLGGTKYALEDSHA